MRCTYWYRQLGVSATRQRSCNIGKKWGSFWPRSWPQTPCKLSARDGQWMLSHDRQIRHQRFDFYTVSWRRRYSANKALKQSSVIEILDHSNARVCNLLGIRNIVVRKPIWPRQVVVMGLVGQRPYILLLFFGQKRRKTKRKKKRGRERDTEREREIQKEREPSRRARERKKGNYGSHAP